MIYRILNVYRDSFSGLSRNVWLLCLIMLINRAGAMVLPFMTLYLTKEMGFSLPQAGNVMAAYGLGSILGAYIGGQLSDRFGYYHVQLYSLTLSSLLLLLLIVLKSYIGILITVFCFSSISDALRPANSVAIAAFSTPENRTRSFSLMRFAINLGFSIGPAAGGLVAAWMGFKWIFFIDAATCLVAAWLLVTYLKPVKQNPGESLRKPEPVSPSAYKDTSYLIFIFFVALYAVAFFQLFTSVPVFWDREWSYSEETIGLLLALNGLIIVVLEMPFIRMMENYQRYMYMIAGGCLFMVGGFAALLTGVTSLVPAVIFIVLMSLSEMFAMPFMTNYAVSRPAEDRRGQYMALYSIAYGIAHVVAPMFSMYVADMTGFFNMYLMLAALSGFLVIAFYNMRSRVTVHT